MTNRVTIGSGPVGRQGSSKVYSKTKQLYIFWGLCPLGRSQPAIPEHKNIQIKTSHNIGDLLISFITFGIIDSRTVKILVNGDQD
jgi:hypothetical protein